MNIKDFFWGSFAAMMLCVCSLCLFYIWNSERVRKETIVAQQAEAIKEKNKQDELQLKRGLLREYYANELIVLHQILKDPSNTLLDWDLINKDIEKTKSNMHQDGFDRAEIEELYMDGVHQSKEYWAEQAKKNQKNQDKRVH